MCVGVCVSMPMRMLMSESLNVAYDIYIYIYVCVCMCVCVSKSQHNNNLLSYKVMKRPTDTPKLVLLFPSFLLPFSEFPLVAARNTRRPHQNLVMPGCTFYTLQLWMGMVSLCINQTGQQLYECVTSRRDCVQR